MDISKPIPSNYGYFKEKYGAQWAAVVEAARTEFADALEVVMLPEIDKVDMPTFIVKKAAMMGFLASLKDTRRRTKSRIHAFSWSST